MSVKGGSDIGIASAEALHAFALENSRQGDRYLEVVQEYGERLKELKPTMATVHNVVEEMIDFVQANDLRSRDGRERFSRFIEEYKARRAERIQLIAEHFSGLVHDGDVILTHSFTKSALLSLTQAASSGKIFSVICNESRPLKEGNGLALELSRSGIDSTIITDAAMAHYLPKCTMAVIGADAIYADGTVVNKMGSLSLAMLATGFQKPLYVLTESTKFYLPSLHGKRLVIERRPPDEVFVKPPAGAGEGAPHIENLFFEEVPPKYIAGLVTELGVFGPTQLLAMYQ